MVSGAQSQGRARRVRRTAATAVAVGLVGLGSVSSPGGSPAAYVRPPADASPGSARVRINQVGYLPNGPKAATLVTEAAEPVTWQLVNESGAVVASGAYARAEGKKPLARVVAAAVVGVAPEIMGIGPAPAIQLLLERAGLKLDDIGRFEINEAQGAQTLAVGRELGLDLNRLNVNGGAIALGHPLAATGVRLTITLAREMKRSNVRWGISSACIGGGQGIALLLENPDVA